MLIRRDAVADDIAGLRADLAEIARPLHQHKRRLAVLKHKLKAARQRAESPSLCFGAKRLFRAQFDLSANGYASHAAWLEDWRKARDAQFVVEGEARAPGGNGFVRLSPQVDGSFSLELRLPPAAAHLARDTVRAGGQTHPVVRFADVRFEHGCAEIQQALAEHRPLIPVRPGRDVMAGVRDGLAVSS